MITEPRPSSPPPAARPSIGRRALQVLLWMVLAAILVASFRESKIDPVSLWTKREQASQYVFGRSLSDDDRAEARRQAERLPELMAQEQARREIQSELTKAGKPPLDSMSMAKEVAARAKLASTAMSAQQRADMVEREYARIADHKRGGYFPPELSAAKIREYLVSLAQTIAIAIWGTLLAVICAIPLSLFAARTTLGILAPGEAWHARAIRWVALTIVRRALDGCRGFNEYVLALIIVAVIGLGPFAGVLALFVHTVGVLGKVLSESIEAIDPGQIEGMSATGASPLQIVSFAVMPQIMPSVVSNSLLRFETNVRSATILGFVGAGGIGFLMYDKINGYQYREVCTMMIIVIVTVTLIDLMCSRLMRAVL
jgi:phosphonate transport system permease protein